MLTARRFDLTNLQDRTFNPIDFFYCGFFFWFVPNVTKKFHTPFESWFFSPGWLEKINGF